MIGLCLDRKQLFVWEIVLVFKCLDTYIGFLHQKRAAFVNQVKYLQSEKLSFFFNELVHASWDLFTAGTSLNQSFGCFCKIYKCLKLGHWTVYFLYTVLVCCYCTFLEKL